MFGNIFKKNYEIVSNILKSSDIITKVIAFISQQNKLSTLSVAILFY